MAGDCTPFVVAPVVRSRTRYACRREHGLRIPLFAVVSAIRYLGQLTTAGYGPRVAYSAEQVEEVEQMLHDAIRTGLPHVTNLDGAQVSILDTTAGQVVGGLGTGAVIGTVPGGSLLVATMQATNTLKQPTREFSLGQAGGEMLSGGVQLILGTGGTIGGIGLSLTGGGSVVGCRRV